MDNIIFKTKYLTYEISAGGHSAAFTTADGAFTLDNITEFAAYLPVFVRSLRLSVRSVLRTVWSALLAMRQQRSRAMPS